MPGIIRKCRCYIKVDVFIREEVSLSGLAHKESLLSQAMALAGEGVFGRKCWKKGMIGSHRK
jgi:hypothetical protein